MFAAVEVIESPSTADITGAGAAVVENVKSPDARRRV